MTTLVSSLLSVGVAHVMAQNLPAPTTPEFEPARITNYRDSFAILVNGEPRGTHVYAMKHSDDGFLYTESVAMPGFLHRERAVRMDSALAVTHAISDGELQGVPMGSQMQYDGRRARGWALVRGAERVQRVDLDTTLAAAAFDGLALMALLPALDWQPGVTYTLTLFDTDEGSTTEQTLRISGPEQIRVPAGEFVALRGDLTTTQAPVRIWVTQTRPHRLVKVGGATDAFATVLVKQDD